MGFDAKAFKKEKFEPRVVEVPVPDLAPWFGEALQRAFAEAKKKKLSELDASKQAGIVWKVRGLTGTELGFVNEAEQKYKDVAGLVKKLMSDSSKEKVQAVCESLGASADKEPAEVIRGLEMLRLGSIEPQVDLPLAVRLNRYFPAEFRVLVKAISNATLQGHVPGKPKASGRMEGSGPPSACVTPEADSFSK